MPPASWLTGTPRPLQDTSGAPSHPQGPPRKLIVSETLQLRLFRCPRSSPSGWCLFRAGRSNRQSKWGLMGEVLETSPLPKIIPTLCIYDVIFRVRHCLLLSPLLQRKCPKDSHMQEYFLGCIHFSVLFLWAARGWAGDRRFCRERVERGHLGGQGWWKSTVINKGRKGPEGGGGHCREILWTPQVCHHSHLARASPVGTEMSVSHKLSGDTGSLFLLLNWGGVSCGHGPGQQVLTLWAHSRFLIHSWRA